MFFRYDDELFMAFALAAKRGQTERQHTTCDSNVHPGIKTGTT